MFLYYSRKRDKPEPAEDQADEIASSVEKKHRKDTFTPPTIVKSPLISFNNRKENKRAASTEPSPSALQTSKRFRNNSVFSSLSSSQHSNTGGDSEDFQTEIVKRKQDDTDELSPAQRELKHPRLAKDNRYDL